MIKYFLPLLTFSSAMALAAQPCAFHQDTVLSLPELNQLQLTLGSDKLTLQGADISEVRVAARLCASSAQRLTSLALSSKAEAGATALLLLPEKRNNTFSKTGRNDYGWFDLTVQVPTALAAQLTLGSGSAEVSNIQQLTAKLGSGTLNAQQLGALQLSSIGSGTVQAQQIAGAVTLDTLGSGTVQLDKVQSDIDIGSVGSGKLQLTEVNGNVSIKGLGSGTINVSDISGELQLQRKGSGKVSHSKVQGTVSLPQR